VTASTVQQFDYVIVGAGPAGLQMGYHLGRAGRSYVILESGSHAGTFFDTYPRHRRLLSINKRFNYFTEPDFNLRHDWNSLLSNGSGPLFTTYSDKLFPDADELVRYLGDYAKAFDLNIRYDVTVRQIAPAPAGGFRVVDDGEREYRCKRVLLATGARGPLMPDIKGIEQALGYEDHPLDPTLYRGKRVAVIGQGNSAFEVADHIAAEAAVVRVMITRPVRHAWASHFPGDLRAINNSIIDMYQLKSLHGTVGHRVKEIRRREVEGFDVITETELSHWDPPRLDTVHWVYDEVIRCTGWRYTEPSLFSDGWGPAVDARSKFYTLDPTWQTTVPGMYCIGTSMQVRDRKAATSFIHGFRYNVRTLFHLMEEQYYGVDLPVERLQLSDQDDVDALAHQVINRLSITSALYQQFGVLCDVLLWQGDQARVFQELPVDHVLERDGMRDAEHKVVITLEYGFHRFPDRDPLEFILPADFYNPETSVFLHPVFRYYHRGELADEMHVTENLLVRYDYHFGKKMRENGYQNRLANFLGRVTGIGSSTRSENTFVTV
jgi:thioredoxin reductase